MANDRPPFDAGFGVYVHWPFCASKCPYCDFNSHVRHQPVDEARFVRAFERDLKHQADLAPGRTVSSIFFGGGTPSLMQPATIAAILDAIAAHWPIAPDAEITMEANPTSVEAERFRGYRAAGVNRVSLGVQALDDDDLRALGRMHDVDEALWAVRVAASIFKRYSFDLIYARPKQTLASWRGEFEEAISYAAEHLSLYQLTIEPGTMFEKLHKAGKLAMPDGDLGRAFFDLTQEICDKHGLPAYEISNHARPGAECRHNLLYWRYGEYVGVGPGAHGRLWTGGHRLAFSGERHPETWCERVEKFGHGLIDTEILKGADEGDEFLLMGLRLREGIDPARYHALTGRPIDLARTGRLLEQGFIEIMPNRNIRASAQGVPVLDAVVADLAV